MASFTYQDGVLIRAEGGSLTLYGAWLRRFGCWHTETGAPPYLPFLPTEAFLDRDGYYMPIEFTGEFLEGGRVPASWDALEQYAEGIPPAIAQLAGKLPRHQWLALEAMRYIPGFTRFLRQELDTAELGFVAACWDLADAHNRPAFDRCMLARDMMTWKRPDLLARLTDLLFTRAMVRLLQRTPESCVSREYAYDIFKAVKVDGLAQVLGDLKFFGPRVVDIARALPDWLCRAWVVELLWFEGVEGTRILDVFPPEILNAPVGHRAGILQALRAIDADELDGVSSLRDKWWLQHHGDEPFPAPPIPGDDCLVPIRTPKALMREGKEMGHCVGRYWKDAKEGSLCFYQWHGDERTTVELEKDERTGLWLLVEHLRAGNEELSAKSEIALRKVVDAQLAEIQPGCTVHVVGAQYCPDTGILWDMEPGEKVLLKREPGNAYNPAAVAVYVKDVKLGYVAWDQVAPLAANMDAGVHHVARLSSPPNRNRWAVFIDIEEVQAQETDTSLRAFVAGAEFYKADTVWQRLAAGTPVTLRREPENPHDRFAVEVFFGEVKLGYVPRARNRVIAESMDRGEGVRAYVDRPGLESPYDIPIRIEIEATAERRDRAA